MGREALAEGTSVSEGRIEARNLGELYAAHAPGAIRLAYLMTGDRQLAEDLVQDAFIKVAGRFRHLRSRDNFGAYLRATVVNLSRGHFRRKRTEDAYLQAEKGRPSPSQALPDVGLQSEMSRALRLLPHRQRAAVVLRYYEDLSEHQAAELLGCSPDAVKSLTARAMRTLRNELRGDAGE